MSVHPGSIWLDRNWPTPGQSLWVAATAIGVVSEADTYPLLITRLRNQRINFRDVTIAHVLVGVVQ